MTIPDNFILSDLLRYHVRSNNGLDHGIGFTAWMHPPVHRILGWISKPSMFSLSREVWSLKQIKAIDDKLVYVKGEPSISDQLTLDRLPTLLNAYLITKKGVRIGSIVDVYFDFKTGNIIYYLVSRSDPRIPGTSRWKLSIEHIVDQQPGLVTTDFNSIDDLPNVRASFRQDFIKKTRVLKDKIEIISNQATGQLEGWLEEPPWDQDISFYSKQKDTISNNDHDDWIDQPFVYEKEKTYENTPYDERFTNIRKNEEDPWI